MPGVEHDPNAPIAPPGESLGDDEDDFPYPFSAEDLCPTCGSPDTRVSYERGVQDCSACGEEWPMQPSARTTPDRGAEVYVVLVGVGDIEDVHVFATKRAAERFQTENMAWHSAPFAAEVENG